jgi:hypothetical protein
MEFLSHHFYLALPFLQNTVFFLYPIGALFVLYVISLVFNFNACVFVMNAYFGSTAPPIAT